MDTSNTTICLHLAAMNVSASLQDYVTTGVVKNLVNFKLENRKGLKQLQDSQEYLEFEIIEPTKNLNSELSIRMKLAS